MLTVLRLVSMQKMSLCWVFLSFCHYAYGFMLIFRQKMSLSYVIVLSVLRLVFMQKMLLSLVLLSCCHYADFYAKNATLCSCHYADFHGEIFVGVDKLMSLW
jgi:hypothetical protein